MLEFQCIIYYSDKPAVLTGVLGGLTKAFIGGYNSNVISLANATHTHSEYASSSHTHTKSDITDLPNIGNISNLSYITGYDQVTTSTKSYTLSNPLFAIVSFLCTKSSDSNTSSAAFTLSASGTGSIAAWPATSFIPVGHTATFKTTMITQYVANVSITTLTFNSTKLSFYADATPGLYLYVSFIVFYTT